MQNLTPVRHDASKDGGETRRKLFCSHYDTCLDFAIRKDWEGFSCEDCLSYERQEMTPRQARDDFDRCLALLCFASCADIMQQREQAGRPSADEYKDDGTFCGRLM